LLTIFLLENNQLARNHIFVVGILCHQVKRMKIASLASVRGFIVVLLFGLSNYAFSQYSWIHEFHSDQDVFSHKLAIDPNDNIYLVGNFSGSLTLQETNYTGGGAYLAKYDEFGSGIWHKVYKGSSQEHFGLVLAESNALGDVYVAGFFLGSIDLGDTTLVGSGYSSYLLKYSSTGELLWAKCFSGLQEIFDISVNASGDVLLYSWHSNGALAPAEVNVFGVLFSSDGTLVWARTLGNQNFNTSIPISATLDDNRNAYFTGSFDGTMSMDGLAIVSTSIHDLFIAKLDENSVCTLLKSFRRKIDPVYENIFIVERGAISVDEEENIFIGNGYWSEIILDEFTLQGNSIYAGSFVAKLDQTGEVIWANGMIEHSVAENIVINKDKVYLSGAVSSKPFFCGIDKDFGSEIQPVRFQLEYTDIVVGFGIDSKDSIYMSGRRGLPNSPVFRGFLFKYKPDSQIPKGLIVSPGVFCLTIDEIILTTSAISNATSYEWEISYNGNVFILNSEMPETQFSKAQFSISGNFSVRVRGKNPSGYGPFSNFSEFISEEAKILVLDSNCNSIFVKEGEKFFWNFNSNSAPEFGAIEIIYPKLPGQYSISYSNSCGTFTSNEIHYQPLDLSDIDIPNIITPNNDSFNESFFLADALERPSISIYNRWGKQVYQSTSYDNKWSGEGLPNGTYYYTIQSKCLTDPIKGWIAVKR
jgi:gliding motility-associated-like protein